VGGGSCLDMDCCNFSPEIYRPGDSTKDIDVLYITRAVGFKRLQVFFNTCKELLRLKPDIKIMLICSIPEEGASPENPKEEYLKQYPDQYNVVLFKQPNDDAMCKKLFRNARMDVGLLQRERRGFIYVLSYALRPFV